MSSLRSGFFRVMFMVASASFLIGVPWTIQAAQPTTCVCYCAVDGTGAVKQSTVTPTACQDTCKEQGKRVAACVFSSSQLPAENVMCFTESECSTQGGTFDSGFQPGECLQGEKYCYPSSDGAKVTLQVSIGSLTSPEDLGEYVAAGYKWMLGSATLIAIVFIMISGLQLTFAVVSAEQIGKAKKRIVNSLAGLVLLLSTYLILQTVNPNLLKLQVPDFPMIKTVALVDGKTSCGYLVGVWGTSSYLTTNGAPTDSPHSAGQPAPKGGKPYTVTASGTNCGDVGTITKDWEGNQVTPEGQTCKFDYCATTGEKCFVSASGGECVGCGEVTSGNDFFTPSTSICSQMSLPTTFLGANNEYPYIQQCFWTSIPPFNTPTNATSLGDGACVMMTIDCKSIDTCEGYEFAPVRNGTYVGVLEHIYYATSGFGDESLKTICESDPCGLRDRYPVNCISTLGTPPDNLIDLALNVQALSTIGNDCVTFPDVDRILANVSELPSNVRNTVTSFTNEQTEQLEAFLAPLASQIYSWFE